MCSPSLRLVVSVSADCVNIVGIQTAQLLQAIQKEADRESGSERAWHPLRQLLTYRNRHSHMPLSCIQKPTLVTVSRLSATLLEFPIGDTFGLS